MSTRDAVMAFFLVFGLASSAGAVEVYVNGVKVSGALRGQVLDVTKVRFAENGDVHVDAPGYKIEVDKSAPPAAPASAPASVPASAAASAPDAQVAAAGFWLIVNNTATGHYKVQVLANGQPLVDVPPERPQFVTDVGARLQPGDNVITLNFLPVPGAPAVPETEAVSVMLGQGKNGADGTLTIEQVLGSIKHPTGRLSAEQQVIRFKLAQ